MSETLDHFIETYVRDEDRFLFTSAMLEGRDFRVDAELKQRVEELAAARRASFRVIVARQGEEDAVA
jgi:hypothetical protein